MIFIIFFIALLGVMLSQVPAYAYVGPGLGVTLAWTLWGPIAAFFTAIGILLYFPIRAFYKRYMRRKSQQADDMPAKDRDHQEIDKN